MSHVGCLLHRVMKTPVVFHIAVLDDPMSEIDATTLFPTVLATSITPLTRDNMSLPEVDDPVKL